MRSDELHELLLVQLAHLLGRKYRFRHLRITSHQRQKSSVQIL